MRSFLTLSAALLIIPIVTYPASAAELKKYDSVEICRRLDDNPKSCDRMFFDPASLDDCRKLVEEAVASLRAVTTTTNPDLIMIRERVARKAVDNTITCREEAAHMAEVGAALPREKMRALGDAVEAMGKAAKAAQAHIDRIIYGR